MRNRDPHFTIKALVTLYIDVGTPDFAKSQNQVSVQKVSSTVEHREHCVFDDLFIVFYVSVFPLDCLCAT